MSYADGKFLLTGFRTAVSAAIGLVGSTLRCAGFWTAIILPMLYIPLTLVSHPWVMHFPNFTKLVSLHLVAIAIGMGYRATE